jgi:ZIP family zinc transporter
MNARQGLWGLLPPGLLLVLAVVTMQTGLLDRLRGPFPPVEELTVERVTLTPDTIQLTVVNGGPEPVTVAQVTVDDAFWNFTIEPSATLNRFGRATIVLPYPWVQDEAHLVSILTSTGLTFEHDIPLAVESPTVDRASLGLLTMIGIFVGVLPVAIGLMFLPFVRRLSEARFEMMLALTAGLLIFLAADAFAEAVETAARVPAAFQGLAVVLLGSLGSFLLLQLLGGSRGRAEGPEARRSVAWFIALSIGLHNLGEGLAIGAAYAIGEAALTAFLVIGFMVHNTTEGLAIVAPIAKDRPSLPTLVGLGALAGVPTIVGAWVGGFAFTPMLATFFLAVGVGAIAQVLAVLFQMFARSGASLWRPSIAGGMLTGLVLMYVTGLLVG